MPAADSYDTSVKAVDAHRITKGSIDNLDAKGEFSTSTAGAAVVAVMGMGNADEWTHLCSKGRPMRVHGYEINPDAVEEGMRKIEELGCEGVHYAPDPRLPPDAVPAANVLDVAELPPGTTHVWTTAPAGVLFYLHVLKLACECSSVRRVVMFDWFLKKECVGLDLAELETRKYSTRLSSSNQQITMRSISLVGNDVRSDMLAFVNQRIKDETDMANVRLTAGGISRARERVRASESELRPPMCPVDDCSREQRAKKRAKMRAEDPCLR